MGPHRLISVTLFFLSILLYHTSDPQLHCRHCQKLWIPNKTFIAAANNLSYRTPARPHITTIWAAACILKLRHGLTDISCCYRCPESSSPDGASVGSASEESEEAELQMFGPVLDVESLCPDGLLSVLSPLSSRTLRVRSPAVLSGESCTVTVTVILNAKPCLYILQVDHLGASARQICGIWDSDASLSPSIQRLSCERSSRSGSWRKKLHSFCSSSRKM